MDLDNIKNAWRNTDFNPKIGESKIYQMLLTRGQNIIEKMIRNEIIGLTFCIVLLPVAFYLYQKYGIGFSIVLTIAFVASAIWQLYKIKYLKKINIADMGMVEAYKSINLFRSLIIKEIIIGGVFCLMFFAVYFFAVTVDLNFPPQALLLIFTITYIIVLIITGIFLFCSYKFVYMKNIRNFRSSFEEIKAFEEYAEEEKKE